MRQLGRYETEPVVKVSQQSAFPLTEFLNDALVLEISRVAIEEATVLDARGSRDMRHHGSLDERILWRKVEILLIFQ